MLFTLLMQFGEIHVKLVAEMLKCRNVEMQKIHNISNDCILKRAIQPDSYTKY